jgi:hypothetical protein
MYWKITILQNTCLEYVEKGSKYVRNQESVNADSTQTNKEKAHSTDKSGHQTHEGAVQAQQVTHLAKSVARRASQGAAAPFARPHPWWRRSGPASSRR